MKKLSLLEALEGIEDTRREKSVFRCTRCCLSCWRRWYAGIKRVYRNDRCYGDTDRNRKENQRKGADYILALKENQKTLYEYLRLFIEEYRKNPEGIGFLDNIVCSAFCSWFVYSFNYPVQRPSARYLNELIFCEQTMSKLWLFINYPCRVEWIFNISNKIM